MRYILIAVGAIGFLFGFGWMFDSRWGEPSLIRGAALTVGAAVIIAAGLATCDIVAAIEQLPDRIGPPVRRQPNEPT
jgi:hypothetical protein